MRVRRLRFALRWVPVILLAAWFAAPASGRVLINEIYYEPPDETRLEEFIELFNSGDGPADISGWYFSDGVSYTFPADTVLGPGEYLVVAESPEKLKAAFGLERVLGPFEGHLSNDGERVILRNGSGQKADEVDYQVGFPWPSDSAGRGSSLELVNPLLDGDLGGSWRASTASRRLPAERAALLPQRDAWRYRKGTSEASDPPSAWRQLDFQEDDTWQSGQAPIGYADNDDATVLADMLGGYSSVYLRHEFQIESAGAIPPALLLRLYVDDGCIVWLNGVEVARRNISAGEKTFNALSFNHEAKWEELSLTSALKHLLPGRNVLAVHAFNVSLAGDDFSFDAELVIPSRFELPPAPTPGEQNSAWSENAPPQVRQVSHQPREPPAGEAIAVSAKVTDPDGVASVTLLYQVVPPGRFIPALLAMEPAELMVRPTQPLKANPAFEDPANWTAVTMADDGAGADLHRGDGIFTALIPPQPNRTLLRYRITASDPELTVRVPYPDDTSMNFACFVYDGVPPYQPTKVSVHPEGRGHVYPVEVMNSLPVYHLITRAEDLARCIGYNPAWQLPKGNEPARDAFNWEGAFVYDGEVYDHVRYRLRQANDRYGGAGKRSWRIRFPKGHYLQARDNYGREYPTRWRTLNTGKMFDNKGVGNFGLTETLNDLLWNVVGAPAPFMHTFHFRVIDAADEAPAGINGQYYGDFWGMALALEDYDSRFLDAHRMADGNLYKLKDGVFDGAQLKRNQGRYATTTDRDFQNIRANLRPNKPAAWLDAAVNYDRWYPYHTVVEAIRHYDFVAADSHSKNRAWYFEPAPGTPYGLLWTLPWDADASWGPNWNEGIDYSTQAIAIGVDKAPYRVDYRNFIRGFRDLLWTEESINGLIDDLAGFIAEFSRADRDRWRLGPSDAGSQDFGTMEAKVLDMKRFAFVAWTGSTGPPVPAGGRAKHLENLANAEADSTRLPQTPQIAAAGPPHFPIDGLVFEASPFADPQGNETFGAMRWRLGEVEVPGAGVMTVRPRLLEWNAVWESETLSEYQSRITLPATAARPGHTYRVRVQMADNTGRWSHWSAPIEFKASDPDSAFPHLSALRVTEVMYNPAGGGDQEFIEIANFGDVPLDLTPVRFADGIDFAFAGSAVTTLAPGEYAVVVKNRALFTARYGESGIKIAGEYGGKLDNGGEWISLVLGESLTIQEFIYLDDWYPETDGGGSSLVAADPRAPEDVWSTKVGWHPSAAVHGSPGMAETGAPAGLQVPGDLNQSGSLTLSDAAGLLRLLFLGPLTLPCAGGTLEGPGNRILLDAEGDGSVDLSDGIYLLSYLFLSGPPPALGTSCVPIAGCPSACAAR